MKDPIHNGTLAEFTAWLTEPPGPTMTEREVLSLAFMATLDAFNEWAGGTGPDEPRPRTFLFAKLPNEIRFLQRRNPFFGADTDRPSPVWKEGSWPEFSAADPILIPLNHLDGNDLLEHGYITRDLKEEDFGEGNVEIYIAQSQTLPPVTADMLRFTPRVQWELREYCIRRMAALADAVTPWPELANAPARPALKPGDAKNTTNAPGTAAVAPSQKKVQAEPNWHMAIQAEAARRWKQYRASGAQPNKHNLKDELAKWCRENGVKSSATTYPASAYIYRHVLRKWTPPDD